MLGRARKHFSVANLIAAACLFIVLGGTSFAQDAATSVAAKASALITGKQVKDRSLTGKDIKKGSLTGAQVKDKSLTPADFNGSVAGPAGPSGPAGPAGAKGDPGPVGQIQGAAASGDLTGTFPGPTIADGKVTSAKLLDKTILVGDIADALKDGAADQPTLRSLGTGALQAAAGNDLRLSDARTPAGPAGGDLTGTYPDPTIGPNTILTGNIVDGSVGSADIAAAIKDAAAGTASLRTLGTGANQAAAGNDSRLSDARTPTGAAGGSLAGTYPNPTIAANAVGAGELASRSVSESDLLTYNQRIVSSTTDEVVASYYLDTLNGVTSMRVFGAFNNASTGGPGTLTVKVGGTTVATYGILAACGAGCRAWSFLSAPLTVGPASTVDLLVKATNPSFPVVVHELNLQF